MAEVQNINEIVEAKIAELKAKYSCNIIPLVFRDKDGGYVVGYLKEPTRTLKLSLMDKYAQQEAYSGAAPIFDLCILREESDARIYSEAPENDVYYIAALSQINSLVMVAQPVFKKK